MSKYKLFLREADAGQLGRGVEYAYDGDGLLELRWYGEISYHNVDPGTAVLAELDEDHRDVRMLVPPKRYEDRVMWLCDIPREVRCQTLAKYDDAASGYHGGEVRHICGTGWQVAVVPGLRGRRYIVAAWVDMRISWSEVQRMMEQVGCDAPDWFSRKILRR